MQDLEVLDVGVFGVDIELDTRHRYIEEDAVEDLAESGTIKVKGYKISSNLALVISNTTHSKVMTDCFPLLYSLGIVWRGRGKY